MCPCVPIWLVASLLVFYIVATSTVILGWVLTCNSAHSWRIYSPAPLGDQAASTMTWHLTLPHYPDIGPISPCHILIMMSAWLGSDKHKLLSHRSYVGGQYASISKNGIRTRNSLGHSIWCARWNDIGVHVNVCVTVSLYACICSQVCVYVSAHTLHHCAGKSIHLANRGVVS